MTADGAELTGRLAWSGQATGRPKLEARLAADKLDLDALDPSRVAALFGGSGAGGTDLEIALKAEAADLCQDRLETGRHRSVDIARRRRCPAADRGRSRRRAHRRQGAPRRTQRTPRRETGSEDRGGFAQRAGLGRAAERSSGRVRGPAGIAGAVPRAGIAEGSGGIRAGHQSDFGAFDRYARWVLGRDPGERRTARHREHPQRHAQGLVAERGVARRPARRSGRRAADGRCRECRSLDPQ